MTPSDLTPIASQGEAVSHGFLRRWFACSVAGGIVMTILDAALIQRRESYFTGGFLSTDHLDGPSEVAFFLLVSLLADAAVVGFLAGLTMCAFYRLRPRASVVAGFLAGVLPLVGADIVAFELVRYLGDALDLQLMLDLTGGDLGEWFAVSASYLLFPLVIAAAGVLGCAGLVWSVHRREGGPAAQRRHFKALIVPVLALAVALVATTSSIAANERIANGVLRKPAGKLLALAAEELTDVDDDGFGIAGRLSDPDWTNGRVYPYALDLPGNGIDEDGVGGDLPSDISPYVEASVAAPWVRRPDVILIVLESFRFDLVGARFDGHPVTPVLDALAARGVSAQQAYSHNGYTAQSRYHMLSGSLAGVRDGKTLIDDFKTAGYFTAYISGQDESFGGPRYDIGFSRADVKSDARSDRARRYSTFTTAGSLAVPHGVVEEHVVNVIDYGLPRDRSLFLYVNFHDTHFPYSYDGLESLVSSTRLPRHLIVPDERDALWATYVNTAANVDRAIGRVVEQVRQARDAEPAVIVTADHGESLFEEGFLGHGHALNDVQTRVPLIVANLPVVLREPMGHVELRDVVGAAMMRPEAGGSTPQIQAPPAGEVFQYLGTVNRPRQIGFRDRAGRTLYDFRSQRVQLHDGPWLRASELSASDRVTFLRLIHYWERMMLARSSGIADE